MPEGDSVWRAARQLDAALGGQVLARADFRVPRLATTRLVGWRVREAVARGKHLLLRLADPDGAAFTLHSHLRMDGSWRTYRPGQRWSGGGPRHQVRVVLHGAAVVAVGHHVHDVALVPTRREADLVGHLGPDLLAAEFDAAEALRRVTAVPGRPLLDALRDQRNLAGVGNVYAVELLFRHRLPPDATVADAGDLTGLVADARRLLWVNRDRRRDTTDGRHRPAHSYVYGRAGKPCLRCGAAVRRDADGERVTYWCPTCQRARTPRRP